MSSEKIQQVLARKHDPSQLTANQRFRYSDFVTKSGFGQDGSGDSKKYIYDRLSQPIGIVSGQFVAVSCRGPEEACQEKGVDVKTTKEYNTCI